MHSLCKIGIEFNSAELIKYCTRKEAILRSLDKWNKDHPDKIISYNSYRQSAKPVSEKETYYVLYDHKTLKVYMVTRYNMEKLKLFQKMKDSGKIIPGKENYLVLSNYGREVEITSWQTNLNDAKLNLFYETKNISPLNNEEIIAKYNKYFEKGYIYLPQHNFFARIQKVVLI